MGLTEWELRQWTQQLAPTNPERRVILKDLIRNANADKMSKDDRADCQLALKWVEANMVAELPTPFKRVLTYEELEDLQ